MKRAILILLLTFVVLFVACSFSMDYVVVNASGVTINVTYTIAPTGVDPLAATGVGVPAMLSVSEISQRKSRPLASNEFAFDRSNRTVTVALPPNQALLIYRGSEWRPGGDPTYFLIKEIRITTQTGEMILKGDEVYRSFVVVPKGFFSFGPPTLATVTYK
jgi:hypothetical protein